MAAEMRRQGKGVERNGKFSFRCVGGRVVSEALLEETECVDGRGSVLDLGTAGVKI